MNWKATARIIVQVILVAPMVLLYPFALVSAVVSFASSGPAELGVGGLVMGAVQTVAVFGLSMLFLSIGLGTAALRRPRLRKWVTAGLVSGLFATVIWQGILLFDSSPADAVVLSAFNLYTFGGATGVALWNLRRAWGKGEGAADVPPAVPGA